MDDTLLPQSDASSDTTADAPETKSSQIFDITEDSISPASSFAQIHREGNHVIPQQPHIPPKNAPSYPRAKTISSEYSGILNVIPQEQSQNKQTIQSELDSIIGAKTATKSQENSHIKNIRTYESDVADVLSHTRTSAASIAIAENKKTTGTQVLSDKPESSHNGLKVVIIITSIILICAGIYGGYYLYSKSVLNAPQAPAPQTNQTGMSIIPSDSQTVIHVDRLNQKQIATLIRNELNRPAQQNTIRELIPVTASGTVALKISPTTMLGLMDIQPPDILTRTIVSPWMLGVYTGADNTKSVFVVITTNFFQNAFAGMLQWEHVMADDFKQFIYPDTLTTATETKISSPTTIDPLTNIENILPRTPTTTTPITTTTPPRFVPQKYLSTITDALTATISTSTTKNKTTASSTARSTDMVTVATTTPYTPPASPAYISIHGAFEDGIIKNKDVREFKTNDGTVVFLYSFLDNSRLVIAGNEDVLTEIISRLEKQAFMR